MVFKKDIFRQSPAMFPEIGCSACLLGEKVRYDGETKTHSLIVDYIKPYLKINALCPEVAIGMGTPRPPIQLVDTTEGVLALGKTTGLNPSTELVSYAKGLHKQQPYLIAYILKSQSPSCGVLSTPIHDENRKPVSLGSGLFSQQLINEQRIPLLVEETYLDTKQNCLWFLFLCYWLNDLHTCNKPINQQQLKGYSFYSIIANEIPDESFSNLTVLGNRLLSLSGHLKANLLQQVLI